MFSLVREISITTMLLWLSVSYVSVMILEVFGKQKTRNSLKKRWGGWDLSLSMCVLSNNGYASCEKSHALVYYDRMTMRMFRNSKPCQEMISNNLKDTMCILVFIKVDVACVNSKSYKNRGETAAPQSYRCNADDGSLLDTTCLNSSALFVEARWSMLCYQEAQINR